MSRSRGTPPANKQERSDDPQGELFECWASYPPTASESLPVGRLCAGMMAENAQQRDIALLFLDPKWRVAYDKLQWILQRCDDCVGRRWRGVSFHAERNSLLRIIKENRIAADDEALAVFRSWPATHLQWVMAGQPMGSHRLTPVAAWDLDGVRIYAPPGLNEQIRDQDGDVFG